LLAGPLFYVAYNLYKLEFQQVDSNYQNSKSRAITKLFSFASSVAITTIWASELEGTQKNEYGDVLLLIYWIATLRVLLDKGRPGKRITIIMMSTVSTAS